MLKLLQQHSVAAIWLKGAVIVPAVVGSVCAILMLTRRRGVDERWLTGRSPRDVVGRLGSPQIAFGGNEDHPSEATWYYRLASGDGRLAMAVRFERGRVADVQWVRPPG